MNFASTTILGAGSWGTALAALWATDDRSITLWGRNPARMEKLRATRINDHLPGISLPPSIRLTSEIEECATASLVVFVTPSTAFRAIAERFRDVVAKEDSVLLSCTKGIEHGTGMRMTEILRELLPDHPIAVLSGPNLAIEVSKNLPSATVLGCVNEECAAALQKHLGSARFRIYTSDQVAGIELGGALKNIFALAAGVSDGLGLGDNAKAALVTRALAELVRLGGAMGGDAQTFYGLSGAGDLVATCFSRHSRNWQVGHRLGRGETLAQITESMQTIAEGIPTTRSAYDCARKLDVDTPIIDQVYTMVYEGKKPAQALEELLRRDQKSERAG
jgi:glycerol-3-phosphate dehydrogenase (NAD(P)+)